MKAEIIAVGTEILTRSDCQYKCRWKKLASLGVVYFQTAVGDNEARLLSILEVLEIVVIWSSWRIRPNRR